MNIRKFLFGILLAIIVLGIALVITINILIKKNFPEYDGNRKSKLIKGQIVIERDVYGVPYIKAENEEDLFFANGYVHAAERLWQMDLLRRAGSGRLSEIFGEKTLEIDKMFRVVQFEETAIKIYNASSEKTKQILKAYSHGVNEYISQNNGNFQLEFDVLGYKPEIWKPYHSIIISRMIAWQLNIGWYTDLMLANLSKKVNQDKFKILFGDIKAPDKNSSFTANAALEFMKINLEAKKFLGFESAPSGSNCWAISGELSESGKPMLASDPHLSYSMPSTWFMLSLSSPELEASGVSLPGCPGVVIGKNRNITWGTTNLMLDDCDFHKEEIDISQKKYFINGQKFDLTVINDTIKIKNSDELIFEKYSINGLPVITGLSKNLFNINGNLTIRWTGYELSDEILSFYKINKAVNYKEFESALTTFCAPAQNFVCADNSGNIFYHAAGKIPLRSTSQGMLPSEESSVLKNWNGFVPFEKMPTLLNPKEGFIASNNQPPPVDYNYYIGDIWEPDSRNERIKELLKSGKKYSKEDFSRFQNDVISPYAREVKDFILGAFRGFKIKDDNLKRTLLFFENWDAEMSANDQVTSIYNYFLNQLIKNIYYDEMGEDLFRQFVFVGNIPLRKTLMLLRMKEPEFKTKTNYNSDSTMVFSDTISISWFDNINTKEIENKDIIIRKSLINALELLEEEFGRNMDKWQWGKIHKVIFRHPFNGVSGIIDGVINDGYYPIGGDQTTLLNTSYNLLKSFTNNLGPSMRQIFDTDDLSISGAIIPCGQSGHISHNNYKNLTVKWLRGELIPLKNKLKKEEVYYLYKLEPEK